MSPSSASVTVPSLRGSGCGCLAGPDTGDQVGPGSPARPPAQLSRSFLSTSLPLSRHLTHVNLGPWLSTGPPASDAAGRRACAQRTAPSTAGNGTAGTWHPLGFFLEREGGQRSFVQVP